LEVKTGVVTVETKAKVRRDFFVQNKSIKQIVRERQLSRNTVRLHQQLTEQRYQGAYDSIQRFVKQWKEKARLAHSQAFVPLKFESLV
jgi:hypothetical protein